MHPIPLGRAREIAEIEASLGPSLGPLTLVGPPGIGKTTLARAIADTRPALFCELAEADDVDGLAAVVARTLGVPLAYGRSGEAALGPLAEVVAESGSLLVLDNAEQVREPVASFVRVLAERARTVPLLVTSREPLRVEGERRYPLAPLAPEPAIALLIRAAQRLRPGYEPDAAARGVLAEVVAALDHLPLAIELSAARLSVMREEELLGRLARLDTLAGGRHAEARQQTLRAAIDGSWRLLEPDERRVLAQCAVFRGGFDLAAAEAVVEGPVVDALQSLREKSLLRGNADARLSLYEAVRAFADEQLQGEERRAVEARFVAHYAARGARLAAQVPRHGGLRALSEIAVEQANLEAALDRAGSLTDALTALLALEPVLSTRGPYGRWMALLDRTLEDRRPAPPGLRGRALVARGRARTARGLLAECLVDLEEAIALAHQEGDVELEGRAVGSRALYSNYQGTMEAVRRDLEIALALQRRAGDDEHACIALGNLGNALRDLGRMDEARARYEEAIALARRIGFRRYEGFHLGNLGGLLHWQGRLVEARAHHEDALAILREVSDLRFAAFFAGNLGVILQELELFEEAEARFSEAISLGRAVGDQRLLPGFVGYRATLAHERGDLEEARVRYREALAGFASAGDARHEALVTAALGALEATLDHGVEAARLLDHAEGLARGLDDQLRVGIVAVHRAHLDLAEARRLEAEHVGRGVASRAAARARLAAIDTEQLARSDDLRFAQRLLSRALPEEHVAAARTLVIGPEVAWFAFGGEPVDLRKRAAPRRLLAALVETNAVISVEALVDAGWPGERLRPDAARNRLRVALAFLRSAGLDAIESQEGGYRLSDRVAVVRERAAI
ncbi:MAG: tetratricopeptide repeat protein [Myxococcales bacterium]|nr:tetratricopeptide repeat protein [Myxococcales bacterium]